MRAIPVSTVAFRLPPAERQALEDVATREAVSLTQVARAALSWASAAEPVALRRHLDGLPPDRRRRPKKPSPT